MATGRMLNKSIATDDRLNSLSQEAMLMYLMAVPHLDRDGLIDGRPHVLWGTVALLRMDLMDHAASIIQEWIDVGLVVRYNGERSPILWFSGFKKNQPRLLYRREQPSRFPPPPGYYRAADDGLLPICIEDGCPGKVATNVRDTRDQLATNSRPGRAEDQDQVEDQDHDGDECTHTTSPTRVMESGGEVQEGGPDEAVATTGTGSAGELLANFTEDQLRSAAYQLGSLLTLHMDWTNYRRWLTKQSPLTMVHLLEWIHFYRAMPEKVFAKIDSLPAVIRSNLSAGGRAPLTGRQRGQLARDIENALYVAQEA